MFESTSDGGITAIHHPFTAPSCTPEELQASPLTGLSRAYDMVLNGTELGGGSIRIHQQDMQTKVFELLNIEAQEQQEKIWVFIRCLKVWLPTTRWLGLWFRPFSHADDRF